jgi:hypothetical protein
MQRILPLDRFRNCSIRSCETWRPAFKFARAPDVRRRRGHDLTSGRRRDLVLQGLARPSRNRPARKGGEPMTLDIAGLQDLPAVEPTEISADDDRPGLLAMTRPVCSFITCIVTST